MKKEIGDSGSTGPNVSANVEQIISMFRNWAETGSLQDREDQQRVTYLDEIYKSNLSTLADPAEIKEIPIMASRLHKSLSSILPTLEDFQLAITRQVELAAERVKKLTLMCGIALLPNDVLADIFDLVVQQGDYRKDEAAMALSHVSQRFRAVALATASLWTTFEVETGYRRKALNQSLSALHIQRSAMSPLDIDFVVLTKKTVFEDLACFMQFMLPHVSRWKTFRLTFNCRLGKIGMARFFKALEAIGPFHLPNLEHLSVNTWFRPRTWFNDEFVPFAAWTMPKLKSLTLWDFVVDLRRFPSLTDITNMVYKEAIPHELFFNTLESLDSLTFLHLDLHLDILRVPSTRVDLPTVEHLSIRLFVSTDTLRAEVVTLISCPNITTLTINFHPGAMSFGDPDNSNKAVTDRVFDIIFHNSAERYRRVSRLHIRSDLPVPFQYRDKSGSVLYEFAYAMKEALLSIRHFPHLRHLTLEGGLLSPRASPPEEESENPPILRTMTVRSTRPNRLYRWLYKVFGRQELQGIGSSLEHLIIVQTDPQGVPQDCLTIPGADALKWLVSELGEGN